MKYKKKLIIQIGPIHWLGQDGIHLVKGPLDAKKFETIQELEEFVDSNSFNYDMFTVMELYMK